MRRTRGLSPLLTASVLALACGRVGGGSNSEDVAAESRRQVTARLEQYVRAARAVDPVASAGFFTTRGTLFEPGIFPIVSRDSIQAFVASFPGVQVDSATAAPDTIEVFGGTAIMWGSYFERLRFPGQAASAQHGRFVMEWIRETDGQWFIHRYYRVPLPDRPKLTAP